jgi:solute carrier family 10 (sodium/bile acid cotransporter), member 7
MSAETITMEPSSAARPATIRKRLDGFLIGLGAAVVLAWIYPHGGAHGGWMQPEILNKAGVALIFFLHGAGLSFAALKAGTLRWPLHLVVQAGTFVLFPVIGLLTWRLLRGLVPRDLALGVFFLCALPSTVSSSVAMTAAARGNVAAAVFNATVSNLIGVVATPLWLGLVLKTAGAALPLGKVILDLVMWLVAPLVLGQLCRPLLKSWLARHKRSVQIVDRATILLLVYTSFCDSFAKGIWSGNSLASVASTVVLSVALLFAVMGVVDAVCRLLPFPVEDRITAIFCASKKTLASGVPMAQLIFRGYSGLGLVLLPLLIYHPLQLVICGWMAGRWARRPPS